MLDDWIANHRPAGLRSQRLLIERNRPISALRVASALSRLSHEAGIGHVTAHQLRHTLATQAINRGMSIDAIAALRGPTGFYRKVLHTANYTPLEPDVLENKFYARGVGPVLELDVSPELSQAVLVSIHRP